MARRLRAYEAARVETTAIQLHYDQNGRAEEKGIDVRLAIDMVRFGRKGLFDVAIVVSEDSDLDEAVQELYDLRDSERWIAVENALPVGSVAGARNPRWLPSVRRRRPITDQMFQQIKDLTVY
jgi:hypothetical protein